MKNLKLAISAIVLTQSGASFAEGVEMSVKNVIRVNETKVTQRFTDNSVAITLLKTAAGNQYSLSCLAGTFILNEYGTKNILVNSDGALNSGNDFEKCQELQKILLTSSEQTPVELEVISQSQLNVRVIR